MACNKKNQRFLGKAILSLFLGIVLISCAGTGSSVQMKEGALATEQKLPEYASEYWNNGKPKTIMTGILYNDHGIIKVDSGRSEIYFENGKIKEANDWKNKLLVVQKKWNENGVLIKDIDFPKHFKEYWDNGKPKMILAGFLYRNDNGDVSLDSGHSEIYFENGKIQQQADWKNKQAFTSKQWNEKGGLIHELEFPRYYKEYYDNGKTKQEMTDLYWDSPTIVESENGFMKKYYENGQTESLTNYKDKKPILYKEWLENGKLAYEWEIPTSYFKEYNENGTVRLEMKGFTGEKEEAIENGYLTLYFNNGKPQLHEKYKDKKTISKKMWYENGAVKAEGDVSKRFHKEYFQNGKISRDVSGKFHYEDKEAILENATDKRWYENGILGSECIFPKYAKVYSEKGALIRELKGTLYYDDQNKILVQDGYEKILL